MWANQKYNKIWHHVIPNAIEVRVQAREKDKESLRTLAYWNYDQEYTILGTVKREGFHAEDAQWKRSEFHKEAYLDQKIKGRI